MLHQRKKSSTPTLNHNKQRKRSVKSLFGSKSSSSGSLWADTQTTLCRFACIVIAVLLLGFIGFLRELTPVTPNVSASGGSSSIRRAAVDIAPPLPKKIHQPYAADIPPALPIFAAMPNAKEAMEATLHHQSPSMTGIIATMQTFLQEFHKANVQFHEDKASLTWNQVTDSFFELTTKYLTPLDEAYRGRPIFPIREDNSVFLSLAAYREHLLTDTLVYAFDNAKHPDKLFVGAVVQNCFGKVNEVDGRIDASGTPCKTGLQVVGKGKDGKDKTKVSDVAPDKNGIEEFCGLAAKYQQYCDNGQIRVLYVHETESLGPAMARYYASKLWGGETYFCQTDSHLKFAKHWDTKYSTELQATRNYPRSVLSSYPPGFQEGSGDSVHETNGARLCNCETAASDPNPILRINTGVGYSGNEDRPTQIPYIAAGFFFTHATFLVDVPFDPFIPWCFMGEEIALSMRAWTNGWDIYAPRKNLIAHQYRPGRMGLPKYWETTNRLYRPGMIYKIQGKIIKRIKHMVGYPDASMDKIKVEDIEFILKDIEYYGLGTERSWQEYMDFAGLQIDQENDAIICTRLSWCNQGLKD